MASPQSMETFNIVLIGKSGHGKTLTANSLLNGQSTSSTLMATPQLKKTPRFVREPTTCTKKAGTLRLHNMAVNVIETPGLLDNTTVDDVIAAEKTIQDLRDAFSLLEPNTGFNAFVLVYKFGVKYTQEEQRIIKRFLQLFGNEFERKAKFFIIFTNADDFWIDEEDRDFRRWLQKSSEVEMKRLVDDVCGGRFVLFENRRVTEDILVAQRDEFVKQLSSLKLQFTAGEFEDVLKKTGNEFMRLASIDERKSSFRKRLSELHMRYYQADTDNDDRELSKVKRDMESLWESAHPEDKRELEREKSEIDKVVFSIRAKSKSGRFSFF